MRRLILLVVVCFVIAPAVGCRHQAACRGGCGTGGGLFSRLHGRNELPDANAYQQPGPPTHTVNYPYYTLRAPRDFLAKNPPSIGG